MLIFASPVKGAQRRRPGAATIFVPFDCSFKSSAFTPTGSVKKQCNQLNPCYSNIAKFCVCVFVCLFVSVCVVVPTPKFKGNRFKILFLIFF
jgi:hypothetical protein